MSLDPTIPPVVLFGYDSSPFTQKVRLTLHLLQLPYTFVLVPSMMPRPILLDNFGLSYRKIPVCAIGREILCDTSLIAEWLSEDPQLKAWRKASSQSQEVHQTVRGRVLSRLFASYFTDRPLFRMTTGIIPGVVWKTRFGEDRAGLIGHKLDPAKLEAKVPKNLVGLDTLLSMLEPLFAENGFEWIMGDEKPTLADVSLFYQLHWGEKISRGEGINDLTGKGTNDGIGKGISEVWNATRYPGLWNWSNRFSQYLESLPNTETRVEREDSSAVEEVMSRLSTWERLDEVPLLRTINSSLEALEVSTGLRSGTRVSVAPTDTGRGNPTVGKLLALSPEEVVIDPEVEGGSKAHVSGVRLHFPRIEFVVSPVKESKL